MPIRAADVSLVKPPVPEEWIVPQEIFDEIDEILRPDWCDHELVDGDSDHDVAGRFWAAPTKYTYAQRSKIRSAYQAAGWQVFDGQFPGQDYYSLQFIPISLREQVLAKGR